MFFFKWLVKFNRKTTFLYRFAESVQGNDFEKIFIVDDAKDDLETNSEILTKPTTKEIEFLETKEIKVFKRSRQKNQCDMCHKVFKLRGRLVHHRNTAHRGAFYQCTTENCGKQYKTKESIHLHHKTVNHSGLELIGALTYTNEKKCDSCDKNFDSKSLLDYHNIEEHFSTEKCFKCKSCDLRLDSFDNLKDHCINVHGFEPKAEDLNCVLCDQPFRDITSLYHHTDKEHKKAVVQHNISNNCDICNKSFKTKTLLTRHLSVVHTENRPYQCTAENCDLRFKSMTNLRPVVLKLNFIIEMS